MNWLDEVELNEISEVLNADDKEEIKQRFKITDLSSLNWALRKLSTLAKVHNNDLALRDAEIDRINKWFEKQDAKHQESKLFLESLISEYAAEQRATDPKWKQKTPYGMVSFRKAKKYDYGNECNLVKFLSENGMEKFIKIEMTPIKTELKKALTITKDGKAVLTETGEIIPEISVEEVENVTIKLEGQ